MDSVLNDRSPFRMKNIKIVPNAIWFDCEYERMRKLRRKAERQYIKNRLVVDKENYKDIRKQTVDMARKKKQKYYGDKLNSTDSKTLHSVINKLLDKEQDVILPYVNFERELANSFMKYFIEKN